MCGCQAKPPLHPACSLLCRFMWTLYTYSYYTSYCIWPCFLASQVFLGPGFTMCCAVLSHLLMSDSLWPHGTVSMGILQIRILEWAACPPPGDLPDPGIKPRSPTLQADCLPSEPPWKPPKTSLILLEFESCTILTNVTFMILPKSLIKISTRLSPCFIVCLFQRWPTLWNPFTLTVIRISLRDN